MPLHPPNLGCGPLFFFSIQVSRALSSLIYSTFTDTHLCKDSALMALLVGGEDGGRSRCEGSGCKDNDRG